MYTSFYIEKSIELYDIIDLKRQLILIDNV